jgi:hypothetical protein
LRTRSRGRKTWWEFISAQGGEQNVIVVLEKMQGAEKAGWSFEAVDRCGKFRKARLKLKVWRGGGDV